MRCLRLLCVTSNQCEDKLKRHSLVLLAEAHKPHARPIKACTPMKFHWKISWAHTQRTRLTKTRCICSVSGCVVLFAARHTMPKLTPNTRKKHARTKRTRTHNEKMISFVPNCCVGNHKSQRNLTNCRAHGGGKYMQRQWENKKKTLASKKKQANLFSSSLAFRPKTTQTKISTKNDRQTRARAHSLAHIQHDTLNESKIRRQR